MNEIYKTLSNDYGLYAFGIGLAILWVALYLTSILYIGRYVRRLHKKFNKHVEDK